MRDDFGEIILPANYDALSINERREVRLQYMMFQGMICPHCNGRLDEPSNEERWVNRRLFPSDFFKYSVHLHHCHKTGMTIGAVHVKCNAVLWQYYGE